MEAAEHERFQLLISDIGLPDGSGLEIMNRLRSQYGVAGIALSGFGHDEDMQNSKAAGFVAHLIKPIDLPKLQKAVHDAMVLQRQGTISS